MIFRALLLGTALLMTSISVRAADGDSKLDECLIAKLTNEDQRALVRFFVAVTSVVPAISPMMNITPSDREAIYKLAAATYHRLFIVDCRAEVIQVIQKGGYDEVKRSSEKLGTMISQIALSSPAAATELNKLQEYADFDAWAKLESEAGIYRNK